MGSIGDAVSQPIPAVGEAGTGYATKIVNFLTEVKTRLEAHVPMSSLLVGLLDMANNAITNLSYVGLYNKTGTPSTPVGSLQRSDNNLWYVSNSGAVQITNGTTINAASVKGLTGDYGSPNPAELRFVDADQTYYLYDNFAGGAWGKLRTNALQIAAGATSAVKATIDFGGGSDYTMTLPAALPGSQSIVQMEADGDLVVSNTLAVSPTSPDWGFSTARNVDYQPSQMTGNVVTSSGIHIYREFDGATTNVITCPITLPSGSRITGYTVYLTKSSNAGTTLTTRIISTNNQFGGTANEGAGATNSANAPGAITLTESGLTINTVAGTIYYMQCSTSVASSDRVKQVTITYIRPV